MNLSDASIAQIVRVLQLAFLTGTDVTDNFRMMKFVAEGDKLQVDPSYLADFDASLKKLEDQASNVAQEYHSENENAVLYANTKDL
jgi:hypothetical protein